MRNAETLEIHVVAEQFFDDVLKARPSVVMEKLKLSSWGILPHLRKQQTHQLNKLKRKQSTTNKSNCQLFDIFAWFESCMFIIVRSRKSTSSKITMKIKDGAAVDPDSGKFYFYLYKNFSLCRSQSTPTEKIENLLPPHLLCRS